MRSNPRAALVLAVVAIVAFAVVRLGRGAPLALLLAVVSLVVALYAYRHLSGLSLGDRRRGPETKDVTPRESALTPGPITAAGSARTPTVVVVEPADDDVDRLRSKLDGLDRLRRSGLITDDEYEAKRAKLIADL